MTITSDAQPLRQETLPPIETDIMSHDYTPASSQEVIDCMDMLTPLVRRMEPTLQRMGVQPFPLVEIPTANAASTVLTYDASRYPGGAFKFAGAAFGLLVLKDQNPDLQRVTTGSAGNFAATLQMVAKYLDMQVTAHVPANTSLQRLKALRRTGLEVVDRDYSDVTAATKGAQVDAQRRPVDTNFLHAYNNPYVIRGQRITAEYLLRGLVEYAAANDLDLQSVPTNFLTQVGGGSWATALATGIDARRKQGIWGDNAVVTKVRPKGIGGELDPRYPGLAVVHPGGWANAVLDDPRFVQRNYWVDPLETGQALSHLEAVTGAMEHEPSAVVGLAAALSLGAKATEQALYVTMLSGRNDPQTALEFSQLWRTHSRHEAQLHPPEPPRRESAPKSTDKKPDVTPKPQSETQPATKRPKSTPQPQPHVQSDAQPLPVAPDNSSQQLEKRSVRNPGLSGATAAYRRGLIGRRGEVYQSYDKSGSQPRSRRTPF